MALCAIVLLCVCKEELIENEKWFWRPREVAVKGFAATSKGLDGTLNPSLSICVDVEMGFEIVLGGMAFRVILFEGLGIFIWVFGALGVAVGALELKKGLKYIKPSEACGESDSKVSFWSLTWMFDQKQSYSNQRDHHHHFHQNLNLNHLQNHHHQNKPN